MSIEILQKLQSKGLSELPQCMYKHETLLKLFAWCKEMFNTSIYLKNDIVCHNNCIFLPSQSSYSPIRLNQVYEGVKSAASQFECFSLKRFDDETRGIFVDLLGLGKLQTEIESQLRSSELFKHLTSVYNADSLEIEFHVYSTRNCKRPRGWHLDGPTLKLFTYLTDVTEEDGPYAYQIGSHRYYPESFKGTSLKTLCSPGHKDEICKSYFRKQDTHICLGNFGTSFISDQSGIHRGLPQSEGRERHVLVAQFKP